MGELLLICSMITLILLVLFIQKKKKEEREEQNLRKREDDSNVKRYSRDDSAINAYRRDSNCRIGRENTNRSWVSPGHYDRFYYNNSLKKNEKLCDKINCDCYYHSRQFYTPNTILDNNDIRKNSYFEDKELKSENMYNPSAKKPLTGDNFSRNNSQPLYSSNYDFNINSRRLSNIQTQNIPPYQNVSNFNFNSRHNSLYDNSNLNTQNNNPMYKIIKLEDFLENENKNKSPMYNNKHEITLDEVHHSLIKFVHNEESKKDKILNSPKREISSVLNNKINNVKLENNNSQIEESFLNDLIPKKIDFNTTKKEEKLVTPSKREERGFESFGECNGRNEDSLNNKK